MNTRTQKKLFDALRAVDTPTICNALEEARGVRTATGFTTQHLHPTEPDAPPMVGYARTGIIRAAQPAVGSAAEKKAKRVGWYEYVVSGNGPTVAIIQDLDSNPGTGAMWGEVNSTVHRGLGVLGCVTNGSVRDLGVLAKGFPILAGKVLYAPTEDGVVYVVQVSPDGAKILFEFDTAERTLASPVLLDGALYLRTDEHLWKIVGEGS